MDSEKTDQPNGYQQRPVLRQRGGERQMTIDKVAEETPVALVFNGISHAVMMATPLDLEELAIGFALTEGIVQSKAEIYDMVVNQFPASAEVELTIAQSAFIKLKERRRSLSGRTGCGVCGIESLALLDLEPEPMQITALPELLSPVIARAVNELSQNQFLMSETGGVHAAAWCDLDGAVLKVFEDVGRHNGLDKLIGHLVMKQQDLSAGFVFMSSRASYELVRKTARLGIPMLATISAPTCLAIDIANKAGLKLVSFCRQNGFVEYTNLSTP